MKEVLYFAYGSNIDMSRLVDRVGKVEVFRTHRLYGYKLAFNACNGWVSFANIVPATRHDFVEGVLYRMTQRQFDRLDRCEALYERQYFIVDADHIGCAYVATPYYTEEGVWPERSYLKIIMEGCKDFGLHHAYTVTEAMLPTSNAPIKNVKGLKGNKKRTGVTTFMVGR